MAKTFLCPVTRAILAPHWKKTHFLECIDCVWSYIDVIELAQWNYKISQSERQTNRMFYWKINWIAACCGLWMVHLPKVMYTNLYLDSNSNLVSSPTVRYGKPFSIFTNVKYTNPLHLHSHLFHKIFRIDSIHVPNWNALVYSSLISDLLQFQSHNRLFCQIKCHIIIV